MSRSHPWAVSDAWWERVKPLVPLAPSHVFRQGFTPGMVNASRHRLHTMLQGVKLF